MLRAFTTSPPPLTVGTGSQTAWSYFQHNAIRVDVPAPWTGRVNPILSMNGRKQFFELAGPRGINPHTELEYMGHAVVLQPTQDGRLRFEYESVKLDLERAPSPSGEISVVPLPDTPTIEAVFDIVPDDSASKASVGVAVVVATYGSEYAPNRNQTVHAVYAGLPEGTMGRIPVARSVLLPTGVDIAFEELGGIRVVDSGAGLSSRFAPRAVMTGQSGAKYTLIARPDLLARQLEISENKATFPSVQEIALMTGSVNVGASAPLTL